MQREQMPELLDHVRLHGRTVQNETGDTLYFNWTCAGFTVRFQGSVLRARLTARGAPPVGEAQGAPEYPWIGVVGADGETLLHRIECREECAWYTLWQGETGGEHTLRVVKLTENARGKTGLMALETDGRLLPAPPRKKRMLEFVGDSITCGYGNEAQGRDEPFRPQEENGWAAYAAAAARALDAEFRCVSVSGISVSKGATGRSAFPGMPAMEELYEAADHCYDTLCGAAPRPWDFDRDRPDAVVVNLGTNDVNPVRFAPDLAAAQTEEAFFRARYTAFLHTLRRCNGPGAWLVCTLGPLDYYLYDTLQQAVAAYQRESGDQKILCFKFIGVNLLTEGFGAVGHPSAKTHARMARELAARLQPLLAEKV